MNAVIPPPTSLDCEAPPPAVKDGGVILCVDDEPNVLAALRRALRVDGHQVLTAGGGEEGLAILQNQAVDVVLSDMRMPGMDGAEFLERVHTAWPDSVRLLLTGHADTGAAIAAINRGRILRYLAKPWDDTDLRGAVRHGLTLRRLEQERARLQALTTQQNAALREANDHLEQRVQERTEALSRANDALKRNWLTGIKVFSGLLELRGGRLSGHGRRVADLARKVAQTMARPDDEVQQIFVAGLLHDIGLMGLPDNLLAKPASQHTPEEAALFRRHAELGEQALMPMEDMQPIAALIRSHHERFDGQGGPDGLAGQAIAVGARILAVVDAFDELQRGHIVDLPMNMEDARTFIRHARGGQFDPEVVDVFLHVTEQEKPRPPTEVQLSSMLLESSMVLSRDLVSPTGFLMLAAGHVLTASLIQRIREFDQRTGGELVIHVKPRGTP